MVQPVIEPAASTAPPSAPPTAPAGRGVRPATSPPLGTELRDSAVLLALCLALLGLFAGLASTLLLA